MNPIPTRPSRTKRLVSAWQRWRGTLKPMLDTLPCIAVPAAGIEALSGPQAFRETLLALIAGARRRILIAALYLQDEEAGREVLAALHAAKQAQPQLDIAVFVDWHRAQRGLIGKAKSEGNAALYKEMAQRFGPEVKILGVPVQRRELLGVMHLKGFVIDDTVLFSGASINDVYLQRHGRYRLDRYHLLHDAGLADCLAALLAEVFCKSPAVHRLDQANPPRTGEIRPAIQHFRRQLAAARYHFASAPIRPGEVGVTPLIGLGVRHNELNLTVLQLVLQARKQLLLFTPYFNLPGPLHRAINRKIKAGCRITIVLGDKTANDFYIPPEEPFKVIGALPYLYESNLRRFCKRHQKAIDAGLLNVHIWRDGNNTFHLKGLLADDDHALLTGNNLNPRAWRLDLENALLIRDPQKLLHEMHQQELEKIMTHTTRLERHDQLDPFESYPLPVQRLIKRLARVRADRLINQVL